MALIDKLNAIGDAIRAKTGKTDKLTLDQMPLEIESITGGGGSSVVDIIPEQDLTFTFDESSGASVLTGYNLFNLTSMTVGEKYKVVWGEDEYESVATEVSFYGYPMIAIGNPVMVGGENNNLPFAIGYITIPDDGDSQYSCIIASLDGSATKNVRVYHEASGGVQDDRVKYVTFIGLGGVELYRQPVIVGDTCRNPVDKNYIETPTKESTVEYTYTYSGWSLTEGGSASSSALANVTEDRTVYVAFKEEVRTYTVRFFDGDTLVDTVQTAYGETAITTYKKVGHSLVAWTPSNENITQDTDCYGTWEEEYILADMSWSDISTLSREGKGTKFAIGSQKEILYDGIVRTVTLVAVNNNTAVKTPTSTSEKDSDQTTNTMTFRFDFVCGEGGVVDLYGQIYDHTGLGYKNCNGSGNMKLLANSDSLFGKLPADLQSVIRQAKLPYVNGSELISYEYTKIFAPSATEISNSSSYSGKYDGTQFEYFSTGTSSETAKRKKMYLTNGTAVPYWTRSSLVNSSTYARRVVGTNGFLENYVDNYPRDGRYYSPYFCV